MIDRRMVAGAGAVALLCLGSVPALASSDAACRNSWNQSSASGSCYGAVNNNSSAVVKWRAHRQECIVSAYCTIESLGPNSRSHNQVYARVNDVKNLKNCDGTLSQSC